jgi:hypothetical protein
MLSEAQARFVEAYFHDVGRFGRLDFATPSEAEEVERMLRQPAVSTVISAIWGKILDHVAVNGLSIYSLPKQGEKQAAGQSEPPEESRFKPGRSSNPNGRRAGSRSKVLVALDALGEGEAESIVRAMIEKAKAGDPVAGRTILERVWPPRKGARVQFELPEVTAAKDLPGAIAAVNRQVAEGDLSPHEGALIVGLLEAQRKAIETSELATRVAALEERLGKK